MIIKLIYISIHINNITALSTVTYHYPKYSKEKNQNCTMYNMIIYNQKSPYPYHHYASGLPWSGPNSILIDTLI